MQLETQHTLCCKISDVEGTNFLRLMLGVEIRWLVRRIALFSLYVSYTKSQRVLKSEISILEGQFPNLIKTFVKEASEFFIHTVQKGALPTL